MVLFQNNRTQISYGQKTTVLWKKYGAIGKTMVLYLKLGNLIYFGKTMVLWKKQWNYTNNYGSIPKTMVLL